MLSSLGDRLRRQREMIAGDAAARLVDEPSSDIAAQVEEIDAIDKILDGLPVPASQRFLAPLGIAVICALIVWLAWTVRVDRFGIKTWVAIEATAEQAGLELAAGWELSEPLPLAGDGLTIDQASLAFVDKGLLFGELPSGSRVDVTPTPPRQRIPLDLDRLRLEEGSALQLAPLGSGRVRVLLHGPGKGEVLIGGDADVEWRRAPAGRPDTAQASFEFAETLLFENGAQKADVVRLEFSVPETERLTLRHFTVSSVKFGREVQLLPGERTTVSTIRSGTLRLTELDQTFPLDPAVGIQLGRLDGHVRELSVNPDSNTVTIDYQGYVDNVALLSPGSGGKLETGLKRILTPSLLTYAYQNKSLALVVAAISFVWGALFYLRRLVTR